MIRIVLPYHLRNLAGIEGSEVQLNLEGPITLESALAALEATYPVLRGTIRDEVTLERRPLVRYFVGGKDWSIEETHQLLPLKVTQGQEPMVILGAIAGG